MKQGLAIKIDQEKNLKSYQEQFQFICNIFFTRTCDNTICIILNLTNLNKILELATKLVTPKLLVQ